MAKYDKFFELAKKAGIEEAELYISSKRELSIALFHGEIENYSDNNGLSISARGKINGKCGAASCDIWDKTKPEYLVNEIVKNAQVIENEDPIIIYKGSPKYKKVNTFNKELPLISVEEKINKMKDVEKYLKAYDPRIVEVASTEYDECYETTTILNTYGLKLNQKSNYFVYVSQCVAKDDKQTKSGYDVFLGNDFSKFNPKEFAEKIGKLTVNQLGGNPCESGTYKTVLSPDVVNSLIKFYISHAEAEEVQKQSSLFIGKLNQKIASKKITIEDRPLTKSVFARWFDDEGVATYNKPIIKNGVLQTYLYNLTTAKKENRESTGNGYGGSSKIGISSPYLYLKPGKKSQEELFQLVGDGVYITDVSGLHAGLNSQSGNFSLQSTGYLIKNGKLDRPLDVITVAGNLMELFNNVIEVGNDTVVSTGGVSGQSVVVKKLSIGGK